MNALCWVMLGALGLLAVAGIWRSLAELWSGQDATVEDWYGRD